MRKIIVVAATLAALVAAVALWAAPSESETRKAIIETAQSFKGVPYVYGAESPKAFDCSGFVQYVYSHATDLKIPRDSKGMWAAGTPIDKSAVKPGDIFVFDTVGGGGPSHVAIFLGDGSIIHAISEGPQTGVVVSPITDHYFGPRIIGARYFIVSPVSAAAAVAAAPAPQPAAPVSTAPVVKPAAPVAAAPAPQPAAPVAAAPVVKPAAPVAAAPVAAAPVAAAPAPQTAAPVAAAPAPQPAAPVAAAPVVKPAVPVAPAPQPAASESVVSQVGFILKSAPEVFMDKIPAATGTAIAFTITNGTGKKGVFHVFFYKADVDFSKTKILREDRQEIPVGGSVEIAPYLFTEPGVYRLNVKTADNTQLMQRTWKVVTLK